MDVGPKELMMVMKRFNSVPLHVRGRAEAWETPRTQIKMLEKLGEGQTGCVYKCRWRGLDCAAKILTQNSRTSVAVSAGLVYNFIPRSLCRSLSLLLSVALPHSLASC